MRCEVGRDKKVFAEVREFLGVWNSVSDMACEGVACVVKEAENGEEFNVGRQ